jgi:peptidoglycan/LPS O-acetylase OafA/YrhL
MNTIPTGSNLKRISSIDGFRAFSIALVIAGHVLNGLEARGHINPWWRLVGNGSYGVFIFFVISGYLITTLLLQEHEKRSSINLSRFYYRRAFRIIPPLYFYIAFVVVSWRLSGLHASPVELLTALTFTRNLDFHSHQFMFEHFWSLCIEEQFYLLWPVVLFVTLIRKGKAKAGSLALALIFLAPVFRIASFVLINNQLERHFIYMMLPGQMDALMFGCWAALGQGHMRWERIYRRVDKYVWSLPLCFLFISNYLRMQFGPSYALTIGETIDGICVVFTLMWCIRNPTSVAGRLLNWRPIVHIGLISYSIYIWQTWFLHPDNHTWLATLPWSLLLILGIAEFSWQVIERFSRVVRDRWEPLLFIEDRLPTLPSTYPPKTVSTAKDNRVTA